MCYMLNEKLTGVQQEKKRLLTIAGRNVQKLGTVTIICDCMQNLVA